VRLRDLIQLTRAPAALSVPGDVVAGAAAAGALGPRTAGLAASSVCLYCAGMAANDWADRWLDAVERPERPIPSGRVSPRAAFGIAAGLTAAGLALAGAAGGRRALAVAGPLAAAVWAYDLRLKNTAAGPAGMALCRGLDVLFGASGSERPARAVPSALAVALHTYTVTALSRREVSGAEPRLAAATLTTTAALTAAVAPARTPIAAALAVGYAVRYGRAQAAVIGDPAASRVRAAVGAGITSLPWLQGALAARSGAPLTGLAVAAAAPLAGALARKVSPT
jgi:4-hydroxybenzoate polyprenyltransferase